MKKSELRQLIREEILSENITINVNFEEREMILSALEYFMKEKTWSKPIYKNLINKIQLMKEGSLKENNRIDLVGKLANQFRISTKEIRKLFSIVSSYLWDKKEPVKIFTELNLLPNLIKAKLLDEKDGKYIPTKLGIEISKKYFDTKNIDEGSIGRLDGDTSDVLDAIVRMNKNKKDSEILKIVKQKISKSDLNGADDDDLLDYIDDIKRIL